MKHLNFLWTVLDTTQLECDKDKLQRLKDKHNAPKLSEEDTYIITHVRKIDDDSYFTSLQEHDGDSSVDFHDFMFGDEIPVETSLVTDENEEVVFLPDDEIEEDLPLPPPQSPPPLRILHPRTFNTQKLLSTAKVRNGQEPKPVRLQNFKKFAIQSMNDSDDSDMHFLKSILPYLARMSPSGRKRTHDQILKIIMQELEPKTARKTRQKVQNIDGVQIKNEPVDIDEEISIKIEPESIEQ